MIPASSPLAVSISEKLKKKKAYRFGTLDAPATLRDPASDSSDSSGRVWWGQMRVILRKP